MSDINFLEAELCFFDVSGHHWFLAPALITDGFPINVLNYIFWEKSGSAFWLEMPWHHTGARASVTMLLTVSQTILSIISLWDFNEKAICIMITIIKLILIQCLMTVDNPVDWIMMNGIVTIEYQGPSCVIVLFHKSFSPSGEQPEQCIIAHKSEQPTVDSNISQILLLYKPWGIITNLTLWNPWVVCYWYVPVVNFTLQWCQWAPWHLKSLVTGLFVQHLVQIIRKETKAVHYWLFLRWNHWVSSFVNVATQCGNIHKWGHTVKSNEHQCISTVCST